MKCTDVRTNLPLLIYGDLPLEEEAELRNHLAGCPDCRREHEAIQGVRRLLDAAPVPAVEVDVPRLFQSAAARQMRRLRRWRRIALAAGALAAALLLVVGLRLQIRLESRQLVVRWGDPPPAAPAAVAPKTIVTTSALPLDAEAELTVLRELVHALKQDADDRDQQFQKRLDRLEGHVQAMQWQADRRWDTTEEDVAALYLLTRKGEKP
jgi:anti-sigma factor RsiW